MTDYSTIFANEIMKGIHKIQVEIKGIPTLVLVDEREPYSLITTVL